MSLLSLFRKKSQDSPSSEGDFQSRSAEESVELRSPGSRTKRKPSRQASEPVDPMLPEKKRARRRLVGAVALVLAAVIGLPMILDVEQKPLGDDVAIQIPSKDQAVPGETASKLANNSPANPGERIAANAALDPTEEVISVPGASAKTGPAHIAPPTAPPTAPESHDSTASPSPKSQSDAHLASPKLGKPVAPKESKVNKEPTEATKSHRVDTEHSDSARAQSILNGGISGSDGSSGSNESGANKPVSKKEKKTTRLLVQVAALASKEKVHELQDKLKAAGISSFTQSVATESGPRIRIRIGPFASKDEADTALGKLSKLGLNGTLVPS